jgi:putative PEP-CTERM system TPR-repeat lipoprotein
MRSAPLRPLLSGVAIVLALAVSTAPLPAVAEDAATYVQNAQKLLDKGDVKGAAIELKNAAKAEPNNADLHVRLATVLLQLDNAPGAEVEARSALARGADDAVATPLLAEALVRSGRYELVLKEIPAGNRPPAAESVVRLTRGLAELGLNHPDQAEPMLREAARLDKTTIGPKLGLARLLLQRHLVAEASQQIEAALAIDPQDVQALLMKADVLHLHGDADGALALYDDLLKKKPNSLAAHLGRANLRISKNDLDGAEEDLKLVLAEAPNDMRTNYLLGLMYMRRGDFAKANAVLEKQADKFGDFPPGLLLLGSVENALGQNAQAEANLLRFLARVPNQPTATKLLAEIAMRLKQPAKAVDYLEGLVKVAPDDAAAWASLASAYVAAGNNDKASTALDRASALASNDPRVKAGLAVTRLSAGQTDVALDQLEQIFEGQGGAVIAGPALILGDLRAHRLDRAAAAAEAFVKSAPDNPIAQNLLALVRIGQADLPGAERALADLLAKHPEFAAADRNLAQVYLAEGRPEAAVALYREMLARNGDDVVGHMALASILAQMKDVDGAIEQLKRASSIAPSDPRPVIETAGLYLGRKDWKNALTTLRGLTAQYPENLDALDLTARVQYGSGDPAAGLATYKRATEIGATNPVTFEHYALALAAGKDLEGARKAFEKAIALDPKNETYKEHAVAIAYQQGGVDAALATARSLAAKDAPPSLPAQWVAAILMHDGKLPAAEAMIAAAEREHPSSALAQQHAAILARENQSAKAVAVLTAWLAAHGDDFGARRALGDLDLKLKDYKNAQAEFERLAVKSPEATILNNLAWLYQHNGDPRALATAKRAYALAPLTPSIADTLGWMPRCNIILPWR